MVESVVEKAAPLFPQDQPGSSERKEQGTDVPCKALQWPTSSHQAPALATMPRRQSLMLTRSTPSFHDGSRPSTRVLLRMLQMETTAGRTSKGSLGGRIKNSGCCLGLDLSLGEKE